MSHSQQFLSYQTFLHAFENSNACLLIFELKCRVKVKILSLCTEQRKEETTVIKNLFLETAIGLVKSCLGKCRVGYTGVTGATGTAGMCLLYYLPPSFRFLLINT